METKPSVLDRRRFVAGVGAVVAGSTAAATAFGAVEVSDPLERSDGAGGEHGSRADRVTVIAHRGFAGTYPENTVAAFERAARGGSGGTTPRMRAEWIELDVSVTSDGEIAVFHDEELGTLTDAEGVIYETPAETVLSAEVLESGQTVPTLAESMDAIPSHVGVNIDIKPGSSDVQFGRVDDPDAEREAWEWLETVIDVATDYDNDLLLSTFWEGALATVRDLAPDVPTAYLPSTSIEEALDVTDEYDTEAINPPLDMIYGTPFFDDASYEEIDIVAEAHDRTLPVNAWTIDSWYQAQRLVDAGVDGLFLDYADIVRLRALQ